MRFVTLPLRNLSHRPLRSLLTLLGVAVAVAACITFTSLSRGFEESWVLALEERGTDIYVTYKGVVDILLSSIEEELGEELKQAPGVRDVTGELAWMGSLDEGQPILVIGWPIGSYLWTTLSLQSGRLPAEGENDRVIIGGSLSEAMALKAGDEFNLRGHHFKVSGIARSGGVVRNYALVLPLPTLQKIIHREGVVTTYNIHLEQKSDPAAIATLIEQLKVRFPDLQFMQTSSVGRENQTMQFFNGIAWSMSTLAFIIAFVVMLNTLFMSVTERTREIGILAAVGWGPGRIFALILLEGGILATGGALAGLLLGSELFRLLVHLGGISAFIDADVEPHLMILVAGAALLLGLAGSFFPALRAVRMWPAEALRQE
ncbi:MAG: ABC transporter permease [Gammaproteobacteria bacterium]|nr:ABC transporter permease [Gammaproteobacteria bacterium]MBU1656168.1 ABC transporter permease [Gammaproteobacteria bacterium]MBU1961301.1 ABC transporter permease [Gammaproteobacteria bacterium]